MHDTLGHLMERNLFEVFGERDSVRRQVVIREIYAEACAFFDDQGQSTGRDAVNATAGRILEEHPGFVFRAVGRPQVNHDLGRLQWQFGPPDSPPVVTGMDVAVFQQGRIQALYVFLDKPSEDQS